jgi:hypothetical protein
MHGVNVANGRFKIAQKDIFDFFEKSTIKILQYRDLSKILNENRSFWRLAKSMTTKRFIENLINVKKLKMFEFKFPSRKIIRYSWGETSIFNVASTMQEGAYFSH